MCRFSNRTCWILTWAYTWNMCVGLESNGGHPFRHEEVHNIWGDGELVDHRFLELRPIRCSQRNCPCESQRSKIQSVYDPRCVPKALTLKSANGFLNMVVVRAIGKLWLAPIVPSTHATRLMSTPARLGYRGPTFSVPMNFQFTRLEPMDLRRHRQT